MSEEYWSEFAKAFKKIPPPISCFANGAVCPWCGKLHKTITFGANGCIACKREFFFGYPDWENGKEPVSFVPFPSREFSALGGKASLLEDWKPNDVLKHIYHDKAEERLGVYADKDNPQ